MKNVQGKWWLVVVVFLCLAPSALAVKPKEKCDDSPKKCQQVPEGGSGLVYLLGAGITCAAAMLIRSRETKRTQA